MEMSRREASRGWFRWAIHLLSVPVGSRCGNRIMRANTFHIAPGHLSSYGKGLSMYLANKRIYKRTSLLAIGVSFLLGTIVIYNLNQASIDKELESLYLLPRPQTFTELYFEKPESLPSSTTSNQPIRFMFIVHNLEAADYRYIYEVSVIANTRQVVDSGNALVKNNQYYARGELFYLAKSPREQKIVVDILNINQSISFWVQIE